MVSDDSTIVRRNQLAIRREMDRRGIHLKAVHFDSGVPYPSLLSYFPADGSREPAMMPVCALHALTRALPADLLSLLLPPGFCIVPVPEGVDYDEISVACRDFVDTKERAHHPNSEAGCAIGPGEHAKLSEKVARLRS